MSGIYSDTALIYAERQCHNPDAIFCRDGDPEVAPGRPIWNGLPVPEPGQTVILVQVESLDFAALGMRVNNLPILPFLESLTKDAVTLRVFAPHKVGSSNSDIFFLTCRTSRQSMPTGSKSSRTDAGCVLKRVDSRPCL